MLEPIKDSPEMSGFFPPSLKTLSHFEDSQFLAGFTRVCCLEASWLKGGRGSRREGREAGREGGCPPYVHTPCVAKSYLIHIPNGLAMEFLWA